MASSCSLDGPGLIKSFAYILGNGLFIGLKNDGIVLSIGFTFVTAVAVDVEPVFCGP